MKKIQVITALCVGFFITTMASAAVYCPKVIHCANGVCNFDSPGQPLIPGLVWSGAAPSANKDLEFYNSQFVTDDELFNRVATCWYKNEDNIRGGVMAYNLPASFAPNKTLPNAWEPMFDRPDVSNCDGPSAADCPFS